RRAAEHGGAVVSEVPPGSVPGKQRFLKRNRLIAALTSGTVVVEAAARSGALSTANHAVRLLRPLGAVPGPVTSMASAGCHELLRRGAAVCVTDAAEAAELVGDLGETAPARRGETRPGDDLDEAGKAVLDALPVRRPAHERSVARAAGLALADTTGALGLVELSGLAEQQDGGWRRRRGAAGRRGRGGGQEGRTGGADGEADRAPEAGRRAGTDGAPSSPGGDRGAHWQTWTLPTCPACLASPSRCPTPSPGSPATSTRSVGTPPTRSARTWPT